MKQSLVIFLLFAMSLKGIAQTHNYFVFGVGFSLAKDLDRGQSPLIYKGLCPVIKLGYESYSPQWIKMLFIDLQYGKLKNRFSPDFPGEKPHLIVGRINYSVYKGGWVKPKKMNFFPGLFLDITSNMRVLPKLGNSALGYEILSDIGLTCLTQNKMKQENSHLSFSHSLQIPIASYLFRSNYVSMMNYIDPKATYARTILSDGEFVSLNRLFRITSQVSSSYISASNNRLNLTWKWDYFSCNTSNRSESMQNMFVFSPMYNF
ncbi:MAG TPA: hypothetical protein PKH02_02520 [Bacteroidales bacterium]|nr:hypothetical protein [Bacteroidales bacterium]HPT10986.1 hypothetical protein [Bacteroidales bacterium]